MRRTAIVCALIASWLGPSACGDDDAGAAGSDGGSAVGIDGGGPRAGSGAGAAQPAVCDVDAPRSCEEPALTYQDVEPIIARRCLGCHDGKHKEWPLIDYAHVASWYIQIRDAMLHCAMPPADSGVTMPTDERETLLRWIRCGYQP